jgi:hypothetical protein
VCGLCEWINYNISQKCYNCCEEEEDNKLKAIGVFEGGGEKSLSCRELHVWFGLMDWFQHIILKYYNCCEEESNNKRKAIGVGEGVLKKFEFEL